uniref:Uncharacterized protein n=1 Tax=Chromera velia CCMP2878 TaxID=1169474 RepID=A0A0G4HMC7_9ALVE|eukprot:Cvel_7489.t1-p1 / transcript=Cvel_7489.t1 / gene=Cvel_7489 / organism=Chromera_velia_CCMP2878 / gene_product=hypothetical protein / transcript_product=hypothetical protein / location=Cvel_scaffold392:65962-73343(-) / protein_length=905 / sequence_SO=supercontig / SO=protein_coding / is_pseudo=false
MGMRAIVEGLDMFGFRVHLHHRRSPTFRTVYGGAVTLFLFCALGAYIVFTLYQYFTARPNPSIESTTAKMVSLHAAHAIGKKLPREIVPLVPCEGAEGLIDQARQLLIEGNNKELLQGALCGDFGSISPERRAVWGTFIANEYREVHVQGQSLLRELGLDPTSEKKKRKRKKELQRLRRLRKARGGEGQESDNLPDSAAEDRRQSVDSIVTFAEDHPGDALQAESGMHASLVWNKDPEFQEDEWLKAKTPSQQSQVRASRHKIRRRGQHRKSSQDSVDYIQPPRRAPPSPIPEESEPQPSVHRQSTLTVPLGRKKRSSQSQPPPSSDPTQQANASRPALREGPSRGLTNGAASVSFEREWPSGGEGSGEREGEEEGRGRPPPQVIFVREASQGAPLPSSRSALSSSSCLSSSTSVKNSNNNPIFPFPPSQARSNSTSKLLESSQRRWLSSSSQSIQRDGCCKDKSTQESHLSVAALALADSLSCSTSLPGQPLSESGQPIFTCKDSSQHPALSLHLKTDQSRLDDRNDHFWRTKAKDSITPTCTDPNEYSRPSSLTLPPSNSLWALKGQNPHCTPSARVASSRPHESPSSSGSCSSSEADTTGFPEMRDSLAPVHIAWAEVAEANGDLEVGAPPPDAEVVGDGGERQDDVSSPAQAGDGESTLRMTQKTRQHRFMLTEERREKIRSKTESMGEKVGNLLFGHPSARAALEQLDWQSVVLMQKLQFRTNEVLEFFLCNRLLEIALSFKKAFAKTMGLEVQKAFPPPTAPPRVSTNVVLLHFLWHRCLPPAEFSQVEGVGRKVCRSVTLEKGTGRRRSSDENGNGGVVALHPCETLLRRLGLCSQESGMPDLPAVPANVFLSGDSLLVYGENGDGQVISNLGNPPHVSAEEAAKKIGCSRDEMEVGG